MTPRGLLFVWPMVALSCVEPVHPLDRDGSVSIWADVEGPIYAVRMDENGPVEARQIPFGKDFTVFMSEDGQPAHGAYVDLRVQPSPALALLETDGSCVHTSGAFRCTASEKGYASFRVESVSDWSSEEPAKLLVSWADRSDDSTEVVVKPPGLPSNSVSFELIAFAAPSQGGGYRLPATYDQLECTLEPTTEPGLGTAWTNPPRLVQLLVRAQGPLDSPSVVENAPVRLMTNSLDARLALDEEHCSEMSPSSLDFVLDAAGEGPPVFLCFSNVGGEVTVIASSGELVGIDAGSAARVRTFTIDPEPMLVRIVVSPQSGEIAVGETVQFEVTAYGYDRAPVSMNVDLTSSKPDILELFSRSAVLSADGRSVIQGRGKAVGDAELEVRPELLAGPSCNSDPIRVREP